MKTEKNPPKTKYSIIPEMPDPAIDHSGINIFTESK